MSPYKWFLKLSFTRGMFRISLSPAVAVCMNLNRSYKIIERMALCKI